MANHHVVPAGGCNVLYAADAGSKKVRGDFGYNDAQRLGSAATKALRKQVGPVVHLLGGLYDFPLGFDMQLGRVLKGSGNSRDGHPKLLGDFLHRNLSPLFHPPYFIKFLLIVIVCSYE